MLAYATERSNAATAAIAAGDKGEAVVAVRDAQHALAQVQQLTNSAVAAEGTFTEATARAEAMRIDIEGDVAAARTLTVGGPDLAAAVTRAQTVLRQGFDPKDPITAVDALTKANTEIDQAIAAARGAEEQQRRASRALDDALRDARNRISQARECISLHRGGIGPTARTRLSEAERALDDAVQLATTDPGQALQAARAAEQYAAAAMDSANDDMGGWGGGGGGFGGGGGNGAQLGGLVTGIVLGGLLGGRGGSFGGGSFGAAGAAASAAGAVSVVAEAAAEAGSPAAAASDPDPPDDQTTHPTDQTHHVRPSRKGNSNGKADDLRPHLHPRAGEHQPAHRQRRGPAEDAGPARA
ncbi:hypothetical protein QP157_12790 [Sphingomonas sp. LR61]|uniref:hypothetical protein n=1 Tax=Sphingomonas sp. LR61 TaxID=3050234 RepID=UPI002FDF4B51